ncbi:MAG TPA: peptidoglycan DD-metalloendopeptidase family protein [Candidatus Hydrogenedens sp.]|nr:peptidoglycan DD-metalloendopeptidase family protein [Candidatus Hydrogenedens sp.]HPP58124.1 peptidoglycan DD-metalloendopeptidase family protein [Candidatus Hydrogenedens sp.]
MKSWTILRLPKKEGEKIHIRLSPWVLGFILVLIAVLTFFTSFLYTRQCIISTHLTQLKQINRNLEYATGNGTTNSVPVDPVTEEDLRKLENQLRSEYESTIAVITSQLNELLEIETKARQATGLTPRYKAPTANISSNNERGKGGPVASNHNIGMSSSRNSFVIPTLLRSSGRLSADLLLQEIALRKIGLQDLLKGIEIQNAKIERTPTSWPIARRMGKLMSYFGYRRDPFTHRIKHHDGLDISAPYGTQVISAGKGVVTFAGRDGDYGNVVIIDHGEGIKTVYAHLSKISVDVGQKIEKGQVIGAVGSSGRSTGPHLHFEVRVGNAPTNPLKYLNR